MRYEDLHNAIPESTLLLIRRNEKLAQLHRMLVTEICIEKGKFEYDNLDNPLQVGNFSRENLSEEVETVYTALCYELLVQYSISLPEPGE